MTREEITVIALQRLEWAACRIVRVTEQKISESIAGIRAHEAKVSYRVLTYAERVAPVQPFKTKLNFMATLVPGHRIGILIVLHGDMFRALVRWRALKSLISGQTDVGKTLYRRERGVLEAQHTHLSEIKSGKHNAEQERRVVVGHLRYIQERRPEHMRPHQRSVLGTAVQSGSLQRWKRVWV